MQSVLANFLDAHNQYEAWWVKVKIKAKADTNTLWPLDEALGKYCLSKLLGLSMHELWEVLIACNLAKKKGKRGHALDWNGFQQLITKNKLKLSGQCQVGTVEIYLVKNAGS
jgi:hypothetical protein